jgi:tetratricopeptide (TPR) repeat protein
MTPSTIGRRGPSRRSLALAALGLLLAFTGCGDAPREAEIYRVQRGYWLADRAYTELQMRGGKPDSSELLAVRTKVIAAVDQAAGTIRAMEPGGKRSPLDDRLLRIVGYGEIQAGQLALMAGRPDLALERCRALVARAEGDTAVTRKADIVIFGALRRMGRFDEAAETLRSMLARYVPRPPDSTGVEDFLLTIPTMLTDMRKELGDEEGAKRELERGMVYYDGLLAKGDLGPAMETQVRLHLTHSYLELGRKRDALAALDTLESIVTAHAELASNIPEIRYTRIRLTSSDTKDPSASAATLQRLAFDFPQSPVASLALLDAALLLERAGQFDRAMAGYEAVITRYPWATETVATALLRQAMLEDRAGNWDRAKSILESIPTLYPRTNAGAQAPISLAEHYQRNGQIDAFHNSLRRAAQTYERMIAIDSLATTTPRLRWNLVRVYANLDDTKGVFRAVDGLAASNPTSPLAARALLVAANFAESKKLKQQTAVYLNRYLQSFPNAAAAPQVRAKLRQLANS